MKNIKRKSIGILLSAGLIGMGVWGGMRPASATTYSATVSGTNMQTVKGWGCHSYDEAVASTVTQAFCVDLHETVARIQLGHDDGSDANGNVSTAALDSICNAITDYKNHGISYIICSWGPNVGMKNPAVLYTADLRTDHEDQFTTWFINICNYIKNKGLPLPIALCIQNEPTTVTSTYDNMHFVNENNFDYTQYYRVTKAMRTKLVNNGYSAIQILGPEDGSYDTGQYWGCSLAFLGGNGFPALSSDPSLNSAIGAFSSHSYNWGGGVGYLQQWASSCETWGKDKWQTEYSYIENGESGTPGIDVAVMGARRLCSDMACVRNNYWLWWDGFNPGIPINEVLMASDGVTKYPLFYVLQQIFTNAPPGSIARRVSSTDPGLVTGDAIWMDGVAFVNGNTTEVVLVNPQASTASTTSVSGLTGTAANVYQSTSSQNMALVSQPAVSGGTISSITMPAWSVTVIVTSGSAGTSGPVKINAAGPAVSPFVADADFSGGSTATNWTGTIDTSAVTSPAPQAVYQSERYGASTYTIGGLSANTNYQVRLHFCENYFTASAQRVFNVSINGVSKLANFDIFATAGAVHKANCQQFTVASNGSGQEIIALTNVTNNALINGIEVNTITSPPAAPTGLTASAGNAQVILNWNTSTGATSYNVKRSTVSGSGYATIASPATNSYTNTGLTNGTTYYYVVTAVNTGGESGNSNQASATPSASSITFKQVASNDPVSAQTIQVAYAAQTAGDLNIVVVGWNDTTNSVSSVTDSAGNTYTRAIGPTVGTNQQQSIYYASNIHAGSNTVTVTMSTTVSYPDIRVLEYSGVSTVDKTAGANGTGTTSNSGSATTTAASELIFSANTCYPSTNAPGAGFTTRVTTTDGDIAEDEIVSSTGSYSGSATLNSSGTWVQQMVTFKSGGTPPPAPAGLTAVPGNAQASLAWNSSTGATSYNVLRSTVSGSGYAQVVNQAGTSYTNAGLTNGTQYYFVVQAVSSGGTSGNSNQAAAKPVLAPTFVQVNSNDPVTAQTIQVAYTAQTAGNLNIVVIGWNNTTGTVSSVTDSAGNTYTSAIGPTVGPGQQQSIYYASNIKGGANTVTVTMSATMNYPDVRILEYTGVSALDVTAGASGTSTTPNSGSATTTTARELIFSANTCNPTTNAPGSGFTTRVTTTDGDIAEDKSVTTTGSNSGSATLNSSGSWVQQMATFK